MVPTAIAPRISRLVLMLSSDHDGEVVNAARAIGSALRGVGSDWHALAAAITQSSPTTERVAYRERPASKGEPATWVDLARWCNTRKAKLNDREREFVADMVGRLWGHSEPTEKQGKWLKAIYASLLRAERAS